MSEPVYFISLSMLFGAILLAFAIRYVGLAQQARSRALAEGAYREVAEKSLAAQTQSAAALAAIHSELAQVKASLAAVEKVLKTVE
jgi:hypothetical protein